MWPFQTKPNLYMKASRTDWALFDKEPLFMPGLQPLARGSYTQFEELTSIIWPVDYKDVPCRLHVLVADELTRHFLMQPLKGLRHVAELRQAVLARFMSLYSEPANAWLLQADWQIKQPFIVSALPEIVLVSFKALCERQQARLVSVVPVWVKIYHQAMRYLPQNGWLAVAEGRSLSLLGLQTGHIVHYRHQWVSATETPATLLKLLIREQTAAHSTVAEKVCWVGTASWLPCSGKHDAWDFQRLELSS
ncbi:MAG: hypothetical protein ACK5PF_04340 [bacterium]